MDRMLRAEKMRFLLISLACFLCSACVSYPVPTAPTATPALVGEDIISFDGTLLPIRTWHADTPKAVIIALHGMNDHAGMWRDAAQYWAGQGISVYAYDQRGFGRTAARGRWPGAATLREDLIAVSAAIRTSHPDIPILVLGHSMGGGVVLTSMTTGKLGADGVILAAPAVWGGSQMPIFYRASLNLAAMLAPGKTLTGERARRQASDNIEALRAMAVDPLMVRDTRLDATLGVVRLMGEAWRASETACGRVLFLAGDKDEIIPPKSLARAAARLSGDVTIHTYSDGWHLLFRDLQRKKVWADVSDWALNHAADKMPPDCPKN